MIKKLWCISPPLVAIKNETEAAGTDMMPCLRQVDRTYPLEDDPEAGVKQNAKLKKFLGDSPGDPSPTMQYIPQEYTSQ
jgi:hypothetical protein